MKNNLPNNILTNWKQVKLHEIHVNKGLVRGPFGGSLKKEFFVSSGYKVYEQKNAIYQSTDIGNYYVDQNKFNELKRFEVIPGDFIISCSGTIGKVFQIPQGAPKGIINQALLKIRTDNSIVRDKYFYFYFCWDKFQAEVIDNTQGGAMQNLVGMEIFKNLRILLPPLPEQNRIVAVLETWDKAIEKLEEKIEIKKKIKKELVQLVLTGRKKLSSSSYKWKEVSLGEIADVVTLLNLDRLDYEVLSCTKHHGLVRSLEYFDRQVFGNDLSKYKIVPKHHFAYATNHIEEGSIGYQDLTNFGLVSPMYTVFKTHDVNDKYLYTLLKTPQLISEYKRHMTASVERRGGLRWTAFSKIKIQIPPIEEQNSIAEILIHAENELSKLKKKLSFFEEQKSYLLNKLLVGEIRTPEDLKIN